MSVHIFVSPFLKVLQIVYVFQIICLCINTRACINFIYMPLQYNYACIDSLVEVCVHVSVCSVGAEECWLARRTWRVSRRSH